jgi:hypothetical protein
MTMARKFPKIVKSITVADGDEGEGREARIVYKRKGAKKRGSPGLRKLDKLVRRVANANETFAGKYLSRHDRSNKRRKNGWLRDIVSNTARAIAPAARKITR